MNRARTRPRAGARSLVHALAVAAAALWILLPATATAHPAPFSYIDVRLGNGVSGRLVVHDLDLAHDLGLTVPDQLMDAATLQRLTPDIVRLLTGRMQLTVDGRGLAWTANAIAPLPDRSSIAIDWTAAAAGAPGYLVVEARIFPYDPNHQTFVNVYEGEALVRQEVLDVNRATFEWYTGTRQGLWAVFTAFTISGVHHIAIGPDHILFIVGLLLLGGSIRRLLAIVTAFTLGHSVTLALATLGILSPPSRLIEPAIALSIVYVGADNLLVGTRGRDVRPWVALFFGLVHGFGFASVLRETGLPPRALGLSLFSFNLGVEIGQAAIVIVVASALTMLRGRNAVLAARVATAGSVAVLLAGAFWFVERIT